MRRVIRPGSRPFIAAGIVSGLLMLMPLFAGIATGRWNDAGQFALGLLGFMAVFCLIVSGSRAVVTDDSIGYRIGFRPMRRIYFRDLVASVPVIVAESDWPITLAIYGNNTRWPDLWVPLKPWRQSDVAWLLTVPELKVQPPIRSLTKRGVEAVFKGLADQNAPNITKV